MIARLLWVVLIVVFCGIASAQTTDYINDNDSPKEAFILYESGRSSHGPADLKLTTLKTPAVKEIYPPQAFVELRVKSAKARFPTKLSRIEVVEPSAEQADGWSLRERGYEWQKAVGGSKGLSLSTRLQTDYIVSELRDYDQLIIDYNGLHGVPICQFDVHISTLERTKNSNKELLNAYQYETASDTERYKIFRKINIIDSKPRDNFYLLGRVLQLAPDEVWRYFGKGDRVLLQRRFSENITELDVIEMVGPQGWPLSRVNFSVRFGSPSSPSQVIEMPLLIRPTPRVDGNFSVKFNFKSILARAVSKGLLPDNQNADDSKVYLDEVFLYFYGDLLKYKNDPPEFLMNFATFENALEHSDHLITEVPFITNKISGTSYRKILNLSNFKLIRHNFRSKISLKLKPSADTDRCRVQFSDIYLLGSDLSEQPVDVSKSSMWGERLGAWRSGLPLLTNGEFQQPGIFSITPFDKGDRSIGSRASKYSDNNFFDYSLASLEIFRTERVGVNGNSGKTEKEFINNFNNTFGAIEPIPDDYFGYRELERGDSSALSYPLDILVGPTSLVYLEAKLDIFGESEIDIAFITSNGTRLNRKIALNTPLQLFDTSVKLSGFEIQSKSKDSSTLFNLRNIVFFQPSTQSIESSVNIMLPSAMSYRPKVVIVGDTVPLESLGKVDFLIDRRTSKTFFTIIESPFQRLRGFTLNYWLDVTDSDMQSIQLNLDINIGDQIFERKFRLNNASGKIFIPIFPLGNSFRLPSKNSEPVSVKWSVESLRTIVPGDKSIKGHFEFEVNTINLLSVRDYFNSNIPILTSDDGEFSVRSIRKSASPDRDGRLHYWGTIESAAINRLISSSNTLLPVVNDVFDVARVVLVSSAPHSETQLLQRNPHDEDSHNGWYLYYWPFLLFMLLVYVAIYDVFQVRSRLSHGLKFVFSLVRLNAGNLLESIEFNALTKYMFSRRTMLWLLLAIGLSYFIGLMQAEPKKARIFFSLASLFSAIILFIGVKVNESNFKKSNFRIVWIAYGSISSLFWACCLICILCIAGLKSAGMNIVAEQFGSMALWCLLLGVVSAFIPKAKNARKL